MNHFFPIPASPRGLPVIFVVCISRPRPPKFKRGEDRPQRTVAGMNYVYLIYKCLFILDLYFDFYYLNLYSNCYELKMSYFVQKIEQISITNRTNREDFI